MGYYTLPIANKWRPCTIREKGEVVGPKNLNITFVKKAPLVVVQDLLHGWVEREKKRKSS